MDDVTRIVLMLVPMVLSLSFHEWAHAQVADWLGDDTPRRQGRLTLNPVAHVDPWGTLVIPAIGALSGVPFIGWAKPVMINPARLGRRISQRTGHAIVAIAGPLSNLLLAVVSLLVLRFGGAQVAHNRGLLTLLLAMFQMNVGLFVFNLLPIAPLDGSRLTPRSMDSFQQKVAPYSAFILMGILMVPALRDLLIARPIGFISMLLLRIVGIS